MENAANEGHIEGGPQSYYLWAIVMSRPVLLLKDMQGFLVLLQLGLY